MNPSVQEVYGRDEQRAWTCDAPMLCTIDAAYGEGASLQWLIPQLMDLCATVGVRGKLDEGQMVSIAKMIRNEFGNLKASEVMLFFYRLKGGHYGEFYGSVDAQRIMRALRGQFSRERADAINKMEREQMWREREQWASQAATPEEIAKIKLKYQQQ